MKKIYVTILLIFIQIQLFAACVSTGSGDWGDSSTWVCNGVPGVPSCGDTITISVGDTVSIRNQQDYYSNNCNSPIFIVVEGVLDFSENGKKLRLPCGSGFIIKSGGMLTASNNSGDGSANEIEICKRVCWKKSDGTLNGPKECETLLPIELSSFRGESYGSINKIHWVTTSEVNNDYFILERSIDGVNWLELEIKKGAGNSSVSVYYEYIDENPPTTSYYRLSQVDFDGTLETFNMISVKNENKEFHTYYKNNDKNIYLSTFEYFELYNIIGEIVVSGEGKIIKTKGLDVGIYFLRVGNYTQKFFLN